MPHFLIHLQHVYSMWHLYCGSWVLPLNVCTSVIVTAMQVEWKDDQRETHHRYYPGYNNPDVESNVQMDLQTTPLWGFYWTPVQTPTSLPHLHRHCVSMNKLQNNLCYGNYHFNTSQSPSWFWKGSWVFAQLNGHFTQMPLTDNFEDLVFCICFFAV